MKIHVLMENTAAVPSLKAEHGLSLYIETGRHKILFDAGQTDGFADNAAEMGLSLADVDLAILSHGHYDHGGGLLRFLQENDHAPVYLHRDAFAPRYSGPEKFIGLDPALKTAGRLIFTDDFFEIDDTLTLRTCNGRPAPFPPSAEGLFVECEGVRRPDDFHHEQYLSVRENGRHILISGCSHKGVMDIAEWFRPDALIGGFHYNKLPL